MLAFRFDNSYARLPERFYARLAPTPVRDPRVVKVNVALAETLGLDAEALASPDAAQVFSGNVLPAGAEPLAQAYAGHQFGAFVRQLGDGRAILLGEVVGVDGVRRDVQLKGAGRTPFSRGGDGRSALGPVLREYVVSEAMAALGVPTTRSLAAVTTGEQVVREHLLPGAVLTRVAQSHLRVGTFEYFAARGDRPALAALAEYALQRHYPSANVAARAHAAVALLEGVIEAQAALIPLWMGVGFIHGVMNTDNTLISGETIDYGPCAFLDEYDPNKTFSSIDHGRRYAFGKQPLNAQYNLARFAETLLPLLSDDEKDAIRIATERLDRFDSLFQRKYLAVLRAKLGLRREEDGDLELATDLLRQLAAHRVDHTLFFRGLCDAAEDPGGEGQLVALFSEPQGFQTWLRAWRQRLEREVEPPAARAADMRRSNPAFIPRNHRIEAAIEAATEREDFGPFEALVEALARPFEDQPRFSELTLAPRPEERVLQTFCGT